MKYLILLLVMLLTVSICNADPSGELLDAISMVESGGGKNPYIKDKSGLCWGEYQIKMCVIKDVNRIYKTHYKHTDAFDPIKSREICFLYLCWWGEWFKKQTGIEPTNRTYARIWNEGYYHMNSKKALAYWGKIKQYL